MDSESQSKKQSHSNELSENSRKGDVRWGERPEKEERLVELVGDQNRGSNAPPRSKIGRERKGEVKRGSMEKSRYVRVIEREEVRGDNPIECFLPTRVGSTF